MRAARFLSAVAGLLWVAPALAQATALPDPTRPADVTLSSPRSGSVSTSGPVLQSTLISPARRTAMIDGRTVAVGDRVHGATVIDIQPYEVRINKNGRDTSLRLLPRLAKEKGKVE